MRKLSYYISILIIVVTFLLVTYVCTLLFFPTQAIVYSQTPLPVVGKTVKIGTDVIYKKNYCTTSIGIVIGYPTLVEKVGIETYPSSITSFSLKPGCHHRTVHYFIDTNVAPGIYRLDIIDEVHIDGIRIIFKTVSTDYFQIVR